MTTDLVPLDKSAASVVTVLENAKTWLATAVEMSGPEEIAAAKAHIRTAETYAHELHLSKDIQNDAREMVRRAEYALGKSIRKGQAEGAVYAMGTNPFKGNQHIGGVDPVDSSSVAVTDLASRSDLYNSKGNVLDLADAAPEQFEDALTEAREEGNLSRANVVRKVKKQTGPATRDQRADLIADLAAQGYSSRQMPERVGVVEEVVRRIARDYSIEIPGDRAVAGTRRLNSTNVVVNTATALEGLVSGVELIDYAALDIGEVGQWTASLTESMRTLNRFVKQIKETIQ